MPIVPTGAPLWLRTVSLEHYGGHVNKENYLSRGAINALTDVAAEEFSRMVSDLAALGRTAEFATLTVLCNDSSPAAPTIEFAALMTGVRVVSYPGDSAPTGFPTAARNGNGDVTITFASSYVDEYGVAGAYVPRNPIASLVSNGSPAGKPVCEVSGQTVRVRVFDHAGSAISNARFSLSVH
jgi:hypothetical protein